MSTDRRGVSELELNIKDLPEVPSRPISSSAELRQSHLWTSSPDPIISQSTKPSLVSSSRPSSTWANRFGCTTWQRSLAFILALVAVIALCVVLPVVLVNQLITTASPSISIATTASSITQTTTTYTTTTTATTTTTTTTRVTTTTSVTTTTTSACGNMNSCIHQPVSNASRIAYYKFEGNLNDAMGAYPATSVNGLVFVRGYVNTGIQLDATAFQRLTTAPMNLANRSFTVQLWIYLTGSATQDNAFFGQQSASNVGKQCLFLMCARGRLYMGFFDDDTAGSTILQSSRWYHVAFVYDHDKRQRFLYVNGILDGQSSVGVGPYLGTSGSMTIGSADIDGNLGSVYFSGYIDEFSVWRRARTSCEILHDATLSVHAKFDGDLIDSGPNSLTITQSGASFGSGYKNGAVLVSGSTTSYVQVVGLTGLGQSNLSYSISLWIKRLSPGVLIHVSGNSSGLNWCTPFWNLDTNSYLVAQVYSSAPFTLLGPYLLTNTWMHFTHTFNPTSGQKLYVNGALFSSSSSPTTYTASGLSNYLTLGNFLSGASCLNPTTITNPFYGYFDDLRVYSRELSQIDACLLAQT